MVIKDTPYVTIFCDTEADMLLINWKQAPSIKQFKASYAAALDFVKHSVQIKRFCTDLTTIGPLTHEQELWLMLDYYPRVYDIIKSSINAAVVFTDAHFKAIVTNYQQPAYLAGQDFINFNFFTSFVEAMHWLKTIKEGQDSFLTLAP